MYELHESEYLSINEPQVSHWKN